MNPGWQKGMWQGEPSEMVVGGKRCSVGLLPEEESGVFFGVFFDSVTLASAIFLQRQHGFSPENVSVTACEKPVSFE
jgi:hypothetical protein